MSPFGMSPFFCFVLVDWSYATDVGTQFVGKSSRNSMLVGM